MMQKSKQDAAKFSHLQTAKSNSSLQHKVAFIVQKAAMCLHLSVCIFLTYFHFLTGKPKSNAAWG